MCAMSNNN